MTMNPLHVNDVHSGLNLTTVSRVEQPTSIEDLVAIVRAVSEAGRSLAVCGSRHAMGAQQFLSDETLLDMRRLNAVLSMDMERGWVTAQTGIEWPALINGYLALQRELEPKCEPRWGIAQKQTGADALTLGGALSANAHGRGLAMPPIVHDVESFTLVSAQGELLTCSRHENAQLFALVIGGYGLFGVIATVTLRLCPRVALRRVVRVIDIDDAANAARRRIDAGFTYGDFQFDIDPNSPEFLTKGVFSCYQPAIGAIVPADVHELKPEDWELLLELAHTDKSRAFTLYAQHYLATDGQLYWSDKHQLGVYLDGYHERLDARLNSPHRCSEMITELYVPHDRLIDLLHASAAMLSTRAAEVIYGTIRLMLRDDETFLPAARDDRACVIFNLHVHHTDEGLAHAAESFRLLIDLALERSGSFFLTYHRWATREQLLQAYPSLPAFLACKDARDPHHVFSSNWHRWLRDTLAL
jgi:FAD/FMN-containing dehydrogenase